MRMASEPFVPTHTVPASGTRAWETPDGSGPAAARLDPGLEVQVVERKDDWAKILCSNGWAAWVDGRRLVELAPASDAPTDTPAGPPTAVAATEAAVTGPPSAEPATGPPPVAEPAAATTEAPEPATATTATMTMAPDPVEPVEPTTTAAPAGAGLGIRGLSIVSLLGLIAIAGGSFLDWWKFGPIGSTAWDIPVKYLLTGKAGDGIKVGPILVLLALGVAITLVIGRRLPDLVLVTLSAFAIGIALCALVRGMTNDPTVYPEVGLLVTMAGGALVAIDGFGFLGGRNR